MQKKPNGLGRGLGALLNPELLKPNQQTMDQLPAALRRSTPEDKATDSNAPNTKADQKNHQTKAIAAETPIAPTIETVTTKDLVPTSFLDDNRVVDLATNLLSPLKDQPRTEFYSSTLDELATSIKTYGILQPLIISHDDVTNRFTIIAGERRWRAAQIAGMDTVPCLIRKKGEHNSLELALIENIQREELSPLDEARAFSKLLDEHSYTQDTLATKVGKDRATIANSLRLLSLPPELLTDLQAKTITAGHARALCSLDEKKLQLKVRDMIVSKKLSVRQTEDVVKELKKDREFNDPTSKSQMSPDLRHLCDQFKGHLGTKVRITGTSDRGKIEISYYTFEDLERIAELMLAQGLNARRPLA